MKDMTHCPHCGKPLQPTQPEKSLEFVLHSVTEGEVIEFSDIAHQKALSLHAIKPRAKQHKRFKAHNPFGSTYCEFKHTDEPPNILIDFKKDTFILHTPHNLTANYAPKPCGAG